MVHLSGDISKPGPVKRMQLTFGTDTEAQDCLTKLAEFVSTKLDRFELIANNDKQLELSLSDWCFERRVERLTTEKKSLFTSPWPDGHLDGFVRLCLEDEMFPAFVEKVAKSLKRQTDQD
ncbi:hypothetical protein Ciccas_005101 [Cichlidogyrus casuarinus]|uniref:Uncharacterized protein n=1 Tax=Cichlidogyrus casuarinus TaxID=1844966 RepID=A0ABD2Q9L5_9PLAT